MVTLLTECVYKRSGNVKVKTSHTLNIYKFACKMKMSDCPLCGVDAEGADAIRHAPNTSIDFYNLRDHSFLQHIIYKHLHIKLHDNRLNNLCVICKETIVNWDQFAQKCWQIQDIFNRELKVDDDGVKIEDVEVKIETSFNDNNDDDDDDDDDKFSLIHYDIKNEDPLLDVSIGESPRKSSSKKSRSISKSEKKSLKSLSKKKLALKNSKISERHSTNLLLKADDDDDDDNIKISKIKKEKRESSRKRTSLMDFSCYICSAKIDTWTFLVQHFSRDHPTDKAKALCICGKYLSSKSTILSHNILHDDTKAMKCEECGKKFGDKRIFREHLLIHFPDRDYDYSCPHCPKKFVLVQIFKKHVKTHLPPELKNTFACDICGDKFVTNSSLKTHKLARHDNAKDHICDKCGRGFAIKTSLERHKSVIHSEVRNFECDICFKKFKLKKLLKKHRDNVHFDKQIKCPLCPTILKNMITFRKHKDIHDKCL